MKKNRLYKLLFLGVLAIFCFANYAGAQTKGTNVTATIVDEQGVPLSGVDIFAPKGVQATTNADGNFEITVEGNKAIVVEKKGYDSQYLSIADLAGNITLKKSIFLASERDKVKMGINTQYRRDMVGAVSSITPNDNMTYDHTQRVKDYIDGLLLGVKGSNNIRGLGTALFVIDGVIGRNPDILNTEEIDQITVLKDASAVALYGNQAKNGVIVINTKRGAVNNRQANVSIRYGMNEPISLPKYLGSTQYMQLYNEARNNDGLDNYYDSALIEEFATSTNKYRYPNTDFYSSEYLRSFTNSADIITEFSGGDEKTQYYVNMGWNYDQSLVKTNPDANAGTNRFNVRGNIDFKVNDFIRSSIDAVAIVSSSKSSLSNLLDEGTTFKPNLYAPLFPVSMIDTTGNPELAAQVAAAGQYGGMLLGGSQQFKEDAPVADVIAGGYRNSIFRSTQFNNSIDFDLDMITKGLSAKTYLSFDFYDAYNLTLNNKYSVYEPTWDGDRIVGLTPYGDVDEKDLTENVSTNSLVSRFGFYGLLNYQTTIKENHSLNTTLLGYVNSQSEEGVIQADRNAHVGLQVAYDYKKKLFAEINAAYINSIKLPEGNRGGLSPTLGVAYILSQEQFIKDIDFIDFLKVKATGGIIKSDLGISGYYLYNEDYSNGSTVTWADGQSSNRAKNLRQGANRNLGFEERIDLNLGFESYLFKSLWVEFNYFKTDMDKQLTSLTNVYPSYYTDFRPLNNYDKDSYSGFELGIDYKKTSNDFTVNIGANILYAKAEVAKRDEINAYDYQNTVGKPTSAIFGLVDDGFYSENDFTVDGEGNLTLQEDMAVPSYGTVQPGDIKYLDQNGDNVIDNTDKKHIGQTSSPWSYGVNFKLKYKGFSLFVLGSGQFGSEGNLSDDYYWVDGNDKYSETVLGRWTPETASTATFPRLSSQTNQNNFQRSTFWMYDNSYFSVRRAQLTYEFSKNVCKKIGMNKLSVSLAGSNLLQLAKNSDIRQLNIGGNPQFRSYTLGLRTSF
ncbi:SusC/RagA family TonB-linked outer membrane protein [Mangrovibacterium sp.]|uniref:SusC/RagA family TonB-linked outer membrane protein n=1 Tax=Mangrovibacterium sp. TaxID=1961364 RepID=UPI00356241F2